MSQLESTAPEPSLWRRVWSAPEPELSTAGFGGELAVAGVRLLIVAVLLYFPIDAALQGWGIGDTLALPATAAVGLLLALVLFSARRWGRSWIGFVSGILDVSLVSALLAVFLALGRPEEATRSLGLFPIYFLAIAATSLRYDARICIVTGLLALAQYGAVIAYVELRLHETAAVFAPLAELAGATFIAATVVVRSRELRLLSTRDRFTGLLNRAVFNEQLEREIACGRRDDTRFAVAMLDIDHFKRFNDTYGHAGGDEALRTVARTLRESCRATDTVARYGGEEFAFILPGVMSARATDLLERFRRVVAVKPIALPGRAKPASVTVSIGVAIWPDDGETAAALLRCADQRLYQAKEGGRDRVVGPTLHPLPRPAEEEPPHPPAELLEAPFAPLVPPE